MRPLLIFILFFPALLRAQVVTNSAHFFTLKDSVFHYNDIYRTDSIEWDFDAVQLLPKSYALLDSIGDFMLAHPELTIEIGTHVDSRGSDDFNRKLTEQRARRVYEYLLTNKNIPIESIVYKGYGESAPLYTDDFIKSSTEPEKYYQLNRRTEFRILATGRKMNPAPRFTPDDSSFVAGSYDLEYVSFLLDKAVIDSTDSHNQDVLLSIVVMLKENPQMKLEVDVHLDTRASQAYSILLSRSRAEAIVNYFIRHGIAADRLTAKGYEGIDPLFSDMVIKTASNKGDQETLHHLNRRTVFKIISIQ